MAQHELRPLESSPPEKFFIMRDYAQFESVVFKMPNDRDIPVRLRPHLDEIRVVIDRIQEIYTQAEVMISFKYNDF